MWLGLICFRDGERAQSEKGKAKYPIFAFGGDESDENIRLSKSQPCLKKLTRKVISCAGICLFLFVFHLCDSGTCVITLPLVVGKGC